MIARATVLMTFQLSSVVPWGRSFDEYVRMLALTDADLQSILRRGLAPHPEEQRKSLPDSFSP